MCQIVSKSNIKLKWDHLDMWHLMSGRKSTIKDKWIRCNPKSHLEVDNWQEREDNSLDPILTQPVLGRREGEKREGKNERVLERERERVYLLSRFFDDQSVESR